MPGAEKTLCLRLLAKLFTQPNTVTTAVSNVAQVQGHNNCRVSSQVPQYRWQLTADMFPHSGSCLQMSSCTRYP